LLFGLNYSDETVEFVLAKVGLLSPELNVMLVDPELIVKTGDTWSNPENYPSRCYNLGNWAMNGSKISF